MKKIDINGLRYYQIDQTPFKLILHGFFTRNGGVSPKPWESLNLSTTGGDSRENVIENRARIFNAIGRPVESIFDTWQVHGTKIIKTNSPRGLQNEPEQADGIISKNPEVTLFMRFADCVPLLFIDKKLEIAGIAHAGWKGTINKIGAKMIEVMMVDYGLHPEDISVAIGPCISQDKYEVKTDVLKQIKEKFPDNLKDVVKIQGSKNYFDLGKMNEIILEKAGVKNIFSINICTASDVSEWYSHRAEKGATGRFAAFITTGK